MTTALVFCCHTINQKWQHVLGSGPWSEEKGDIPSLTKHRTENVPIFLLLSAFNVRIRLQNMGQSSISDVQCCMVVNIFVLGKRRGNQRLLIFDLNFRSVYYLVSWKIPEPPGTVGGDVCPDISASITQVLLMYMHLHKWPFSPWLVHAEDSLFFQCKLWKSLCAQGVVPSLKATIFFCRILKCIRGMDGVFNIIQLSRKPQVYMQNRIFQPLLSSWHPKVDSRSQSISWNNTVGRGSCKDFLSNRNSFHLIGAIVYPIPNTHPFILESRIYDLH